jgi:hypothetical protein
MSGFTAQSVYGASTQAPSYAVAQPTQAMAIDVDIPNGWRGLISPSNPLFWVGALVLAAVGAGAVAGSVRLGPAKIAAKVGD